MVYLRPVDVYSLHKGRRWQAVSVDVESCDVGRATRLLRTELVAGKEEQSQAAVSVLAAQRDEAWHLSDVS